MTAPGNTPTRLAHACRTVPFSNGTEGDAWMFRWCEFCTHDHKIHTGDGPGCPIIGGAMFERPFRWPEAWLPEPDDGSFALPSRMICGSFTPCTEGDCTGDPGADERSERVAEVTAYWQQHGSEPR